MPCGAGYKADSDAMSNFGVLKTVVREDASMNAQTRGQDFPANHSLRIERSPGPKPVTFQYPLHILSQSAARKIRLRLQTTAVAMLLITRLYPAPCTDVKIVIRNWDVANSGCADAHLTALIDKRCSSQSLLALITHICN